MLIAAWPAHAAIAHVQTVSCQASGATTCTAGPITTTTGNLFVASVGFCCEAFTSVTDSKSNTYTDSIAELTVVGTHGLQQYKENGSGGTSHTFTLTGASAAFFGTLSVSEISGALTSGALDQTATDTDASGTSHATAATSATAQTNELLLGFGTSGLTTTYITDTGAGWNELTNEPTDADEGLLTGYRIVSAIGTYTFSYTTGSSVDAVHGISTWRAAASSARQRCIGCEIDKKVIGN